MNQSKSRGTFEHRRTQSIEQELKEKLKRKFINSAHTLECRQKLANMSPEQREEVKRRLMRKKQYTGMVAGLFNQMRV